MATVTHKKIATAEDHPQAEINKGEWNDNHNVSDISHTDILPSAFPLGAIGSNAGATFIVTGPKVAGSSPPERAPSTQALVDYYLNLGIPANNILWNVVGESGAGGDFIISEMSVQSFLDSITITNPGETLLVQDAIGASTIDEVILELASGEFTIPDMVAASMIDGIVLALAGGEFTIADLAGASVMDNIAIIQTPVTPVISVTAGDTKNTIALTSGGTPATSYNVKWGTTSGQRTNTITGVTLPYDHTGRTNGVTYYYSLVAINSGISSESTEANGTPAAGVSGDLANGSLDGWSVSFAPGGDALSGVQTGAIDTGVYHSGTSSFKAHAGEGYFTDDGYYYWDQVILSKTVTVGAGNITLWYKCTSAYPTTLIVMQEGVVNYIASTLNTDGNWHQLSGSTAGFTGSRALKVVVISGSQPGDAGGHTIDVYVTELVIP